MSRFLDRLSRTPGLTTPFDKEFDEGPEYVIIQSPPGLQTGKIQPTAALRENKKAVRSKREINLKTTPEYLADLRQYQSIPREIILTLGDDSKYVPKALISNLLYARKAPGAVIVPKTNDHIQSVIKFANTKERQIPLTVQGGGHSYGSYALKEGGILLDMKNFNKMEINSEQTEVTIGAGCRWIDVYNHLKEKGCTKMVLGGKCQDVGVSGYILGGGISPFSRGFGLGIDSVTSMTIITASGDSITVSNKSEGEEVDLFWALRGGGGGNFGVLTEFTTKIHKLADPGGKVIYGVLTWDLEDLEQQSAFEGAIKTLTDDPEAWENKRNLTIDIIWQDKNKKPTGGLMVIYDGPMEGYQEAIKPLTRFIYDSQVRKLDWQDVAVKEQGWSTESPAFHYHASFVLEQEQVTVELAQEIDKLMKTTREDLKKHDSNAKAYLIWVHTGGKVAELDPEAKETVFPWRKAVYVGYFKLQWYEGGIANTMIEFVENNVKKGLLLEIMKKAAYVNFVDRNILKWEQMYYGSYYERLQGVKKQWDPDNFFNFDQSIKLPGTTVEDPQNAINWNEHALRCPKKIWPTDPSAVKLDPKKAKEKREEEVWDIIRKELLSPN